MFLSSLGWVLSPFYDLLNVKMILPENKEDITLMLGGKKESFNKGYFDQGLKLNNKQIQGVYNRLEKWLPKTIELIQLSFLDEQRQSDNIKLFSKHTGLFFV